jgi:hypothetical protein
MEGDSVLRQVRAGFLRGSSVGFISHKVIDVKDEEERAQLGLGRWGFVLDENELLEGSPTLLPANTNAGAILALGKKQGLIQPLDLEVIRELSRLAFVNERAEVPQGKTAQQAWKEQDDTWLAIARLLFPSDHWLRARTLSEPILRHEDEEPKPPAEEPKASSLEEKVDRVLALVETIGVSLSQRLEDIRGLLEDREAETPANENGRAAAHAERTPAPNPLQEVDERMERMLRTIDQGRAAAAAK